MIDQTVSSQSALDIIMPWIQARSALNSLSKSNASILGKDFCNYSMDMMLHASLWSMSKVLSIIFSND